MSRLECIPIFSEKAVAIEDFRAVYDIVQCICFRPHRIEIETEIETETETADWHSEEKDGGETRDKEVGRKRKRKRRDSRFSPSLSPSSAAEAKAEVEIRSSSSSLSLPFSVGYREVLDIIRETYESASLRDKKSWNVENDGKGNCVCSETPSEFLSSTTKPRRSSNSDSDSDSNEGGNKNGTRTKRKTSKHKDDADTNGYCSFVLQDNSNNAVANFTKRMESLVARCGRTTYPSMRMMLPHTLLLTRTINTSTDCEEENAPVTGGRKNTIPPLLTMAPHYWIFVGRNKHRGSGEGEWLSGRREHTDSIEHDGTFHHQLLGSKLWKLRPTLELRERCDRDHDLALLDSYEIMVEEGDVFVINTKLWWHQTELPPSFADMSEDRSWSVSYARDLYLDGKEARVAFHGATSQESKLRKNNCNDCNESDDADGVLGTNATDPTGRESMANVEVSWASGFIPKGTTLVVDDAIDDGDRDDDECSNIDVDDDDTVASLYHHLVPPTIGRTCLESRANCKLVLLSNEPGPDGDAFELEQEGEKRRTKDSCSEAVARLKPGMRKIALETIRDIQEGENFVILLKEKIPYRSNLREQL
jgi:hypothetical protein